MLIELDKKDLVNLVRGIEPGYDNMHLAKDYGTFSGSYDRWTWNIHRLNELTEEELLKIHKLFKEV